ncbi:MAG TPA: hypothetical protein VMG99_06660 [Thermoplasmata archaeon]|nr:hypothetical protein [Thermoplasmata archaeon]
MTEAADRDIGLNPAQRRRIGVTARVVEGRIESVLRELREEPRLPAEARTTLSEGLEGLRQEVKRFASDFGEIVSAPPIDRRTDASLVRIWAALEELRPRRLAAYGQLPGARAAALERRLEALVAADERLLALLRESVGARSVGEGGPTPAPARAPVPLAAEASTRLPPYWLYVEDEPRWVEALRAAQGGRGPRIVHVDPSPASPGPWALYADRLEDLARSSLPDDPSDVRGPELVILDIYYPAGPSMPPDALALEGRYVAGGPRLAARLRGDPSFDAPQVFYSSKAARELTDAGMQELLAPEGTYYLPKVPAGEQAALRLFERVAHPGSAAP